MQIEISFRIRWLSSLPSNTCACVAVVTIAGMRKFFFSLLNFYFRSFLRVYFCSSPFRVSNFTCFNAINHAWLHAWRNLCAYQLKRCHTSFTSHAGQMEKMIINTIESNQILKMNLWEDSAELLLFDRIYRRVAPSFCLARTEKVFETQHIAYSVTNIND